MIYFIGEEFNVKDEGNYTIGDYVSAEFGLKFKVINLEAEALLKTFKENSFKKFSILITSIKDDIVVEKVSKQCIVGEICHYNFKNLVGEVYEDSYLVLDRFYANSIDNYDKLLEVYDEVQKRMDYTIYDDIFEKHLSKGSFLELGAGSGNVTEMLVKYPLDIVATDLNPKFLEVLDNKNLLVRTEVLNIENINTMDSEETYDYVGMFLDTLNYLEPIYLNDIFLGICKKLKSKGKLFFDIHQTEKIEIFDQYIEQIRFPNFTFNWLSEQIDDNIVEHIFTFINKGISIEKHKQYIYDIEFYRQVYSKYFKELDVVSRDGRIIIVLEKLE